MEQAPFEDSVVETCPAERTVLEIPSALFTSLQALVSHSSGANTPTRDATDADNDETVEAAEDLQDC